MNDLAAYCFILIHSLQSTLSLKKTVFSVVFSLFTTPPSHYFICCSSFYTALFVSSDSMILVNTSPRVIFLVKSEECGYNSESKGLISYLVSSFDVSLPRKHGTFTHRCFHVGPASKHHWAKISCFRVVPAERQNIGLPLSHCLDNVCGVG